MRNRFLALLMLFSVCTLLSAADLSGKWTLSLDPDFSGNPDSVDCTFKQDGTKLTVRCGIPAENRPPIIGELNGQNVTLRVPTGEHDQLTATFTGTLDAESTTIKGTWQLVDAEGAKNGKFNAKKR
jgi:hypothetical protein